MQAVPAFSFSSYCIQMLLLNPENDTEPNRFRFANIQQHSTDAVRLVNPRLPSLTRCDFVTALLLCSSSLRMVTFLSHFRLTRVLPIDQ